MVLSLYHSRRNSARNRTFHHLAVLLLRSLVGASSAQGASTPGGKSHGTPPTSLATRSATMFSKSSSVGGAKRNKDKRRSSRGKAERDSNPQTPQSTAVTPTTTTTTQWYMASPLPADTDRITWAVGTPVFELRQENGPTKNGTCLSLARGQLTPKRPLRSEVERERRLSRPSCGQFPPTRLSTTGANMTTARFNGSSSNRDSIGPQGKHDTEAATLTLSAKASELPPVHTVSDPDVVLHLSDPAYLAVAGLSDHPSPEQVTMDPALERPEP
uniref:Uncharacterized protein n=1 Tax=Timema monikensis TaxID=170555 RepID=A0A7R9E9G1_9NEOP|nr:unnamed protein product [Timema monikensis]